VNWTGPAELKRQVRRLWETGEILRARLEGEPLFPRRLTLKRPTSQETAERFGEVRDWIRALQASESAPGRPGYTLQWQEIRHRVHGANRVPVAAFVASEAAALALIGQHQAAARFSELAARTVARFPALRPWVARHPHLVLEQAEAWTGVLAVLAWFAAHPRSGLYLRELDIPGVDSKFIEHRRALLGELLDLVLPAATVDANHVGAKAFERRFGLRSKPALVRFRLLDPALYLHGLSDISVPASQFATLTMPVRRVFVTENEINGLAFPDIPESLVIFGLGYSLERLSETAWLHDVEVLYWGDIDTHGYAILDRFRATLPHVRSMLMDRDTLLAHRPLWVQEPQASRFLGELTRLTDAEQGLYRDLRDDRLGERVRLEQERVAFSHLEEALATLGHLSHHEA
jgi:hypothetical protein